VGNADGMAVYSSGRFSPALHLRSGRPLQVSDKPGLHNLVMLTQGVEGKRLGDQLSKCQGMHDVASIFRRQLMPEPEGLNFSLLLIHDLAQAS
jgi:hypothetical protein